eukprot:Seg4324.1 transcript_id=Seg4324.1/GoldUCD/mRNA.D3Y31 product="hypothetical protein" protein_id=Seg4324.1/GoldUCD/D3Y31
MPKFRESRATLLHTHYNGFISDEEFVLLYDINTAKSPNLPYWIYDPFDLDEMSDDECKCEFRFLRSDVYRLIEAMYLPDTFTCYNGLKFEAVEGICVFLKRFAYPCRYLDLISRFARPVPQLCLMSNLVMAHIYAQWESFALNIQSALAFTRKP